MRKSKEKYQENRKKLIELSQGARALIETGEYATVNEALIGVYAEENEGIEKFKTFGQWKNDGYTIVKGSTAFLVWGQPRKVEQVPEGADEPEEFKYWPLCYLFANTQVFKPGEEKPIEQIDLPKNENTNISQLLN